MLALDSMRLEKGYRSWKGDLTSDYNLFDCGLGRWVHFSKNKFVGREALMELKDTPHRQSHWRLMMLMIILIAGSCLSFICLQ